MPNGKKEKHPAFGMLSFSRVSSSGGVPLHGSDLTHSTFIKMELRHGSKERDLSRDWYFAESLVSEVWMSQNQFSELITSMNIGDGVPVTLVRTEKDGEIESPSFESITGIHEDEFREQAKEVAHDAEDLLSVITDLLSGSGTVKKADRQAIINKAEKVVREIKANMPFMEKSFRKAMDKTVVDAKGTIEAFYQHRVVDAGLEALAAAPAPKLIEDKEED